MIVQRVIKGTVIRGGLIQDSTTAENLTQVMETAVTSIAGTTMHAVIVRDVSTPKKHRL